jgi:hypothetical protein
MTARRMARNKIRIEKQAEARLVKVEPKQPQINLISQVKSPDGFTSLTNQKAVQTQAIQLDNSYL